MKFEKITLIYKKVIYKMIYHIIGVELDNF